jgi:hypothetical protein
MNSTHLDVTYVLQYCPLKSGGNRDALTRMAANHSKGSTEEEARSLTPSSSIMRVAGSVGQKA